MGLEYGSLRRRTRDSSWQWLIMGMILGIGFAAVACVGGYAVGAVAFPALEEDTATPEVQIAPNETEIAMQPVPTNTVAPDTEPDQTDQQVADLQATIAAMEAANTDSQVDDTADTSDTDGAGGDAVSTPAPTPLPDMSTNGDTEQAGDTTETQQLPQDSQPVGTPVTGLPTPSVAFDTGPAIPPELANVASNMVRVDGGTFLMGTSPEEAQGAMDDCSLWGDPCNDPSFVNDSIPTHQTTVDPFMMEVYEVSVAQYVAFLNWKGPNSHQTGCQGEPCAATRTEQEFSYIEFDGTTYTILNPGFYDSHPVTYVTWYGAQEYCQTLDRRLPTEAEWERAARGSDNRIYPWGNSFDPDRAMSSVIDDSNTVPVNSYPTGVSPYEIYNMAGNVSEWVYDWYDANYYQLMVNDPVPNPRGPSTGLGRVHRGGSWDTKPLFLRTVHRMSWPEGDGGASIGFRCASDIISPASSAPATGSDNQTTGDTQPGGAPTMAPAPTQEPLPSVTPGPTQVLDPG